MNLDEIRRLFTQDQRMQVEYSDARREVLPHVVRHVNTTGIDGTVLYARLDAANADRIIEEQIAYFEGIGQDFEWKCFDYDEPPDLKQRLERRGFVQEEEGGSVMVLEVRQAPAVLRQAVTHDVRRMDDPEEMSRAVRAVEGAVWDLDFTRLTGVLAEDMRRSPEVRSIYVAYAGDQPVATAWIYFPPHSRFASLWGGSTRAEYRGRGLYTALLAIRLQEALRRGVTYLSVDASSMSRPILEKYGFVKIAAESPMMWRCKP
ncbi:MAG: GNAT family N-acetyltransferase [Anaerolineaceae bacterium]|nr:GNAT family N-acetyltransferase [Anaerolineaceae bacterium]